VSGARIHHDDFFSESRARAQGEPERVATAIYHHYLPVGIEADAPPTREALGAAGVTWAAVSMADKLDTLVGLFHAGEKPTGSRDPFGLRRQAQGLIRVLVDLPELTGLDARLSLGELLGSEGLRGERRLVPPPLEGYPALEDTALGPSANIGGFYFAICLPRKDGTLAAEAKAPVDDELAERRFVAYAWPSRPAPGLKRAYFIDEHERILVASAKTGKRLGPDAPPPCDDAIAEAMPQ